MNIGKGMVAYQGHSFSDGYEAGYEARDKEAEEEKRELIEMLIDIAEYRLFYEDSMGQNTSLEIKIKTLIEKYTGKSIEELLK